ncbi:MAG: phosphoenolpyruvate carboxykinase (GTP) [Defluviitaleaceae bacterium]|nr:phosphoenolpyruvate carboxykinase (GTP) [Defluviitaleaceae bacterium]
MNTKVRQWVDEIVTMCEPDEIVWITGSKEQYDKLYEEACKSGELIKLNQEKHPNCYLHRSRQNDVARTEDKTFICCDNKEDAGPTNNWCAPDEMYSKLKKIYKGSMKGKKMYLIPFAMGVVGSKFTKYGIEASDSIYVVLNMEKMARVGQAALDKINETGDFVKCLHASKDVDFDERYIAHFPHDNTIWSINSAYGGNALLSKKCFALRIASCNARDEDWLAEHMLILGIENPQGEVSYIAAAFPSACGKTNLAMIVPPELYAKKGYKVWCVGDDIAWIRIGDDGRLWAMNAESGFFGVAPGTSRNSNPNMLKTLESNAIFTNVVHNLNDNTIWWEGLPNPPTDALDWKNEKWSVEDGTKGAHPNSRFTVKAEQCPCISKEFDNPNGVPLSAIIFGGRRAKTFPLVLQSKDWEHGVFIGSIMGSETTAAATSAVGVVRRDPMAMLPFCGYNMADYFNHWLNVGKKLTNPPKIFNVNWFRTDDDGNFVWPGFSDNMRVLDWIIRRSNDVGEAELTPIGFVPTASEININELNGITTDIIKNLLSLDNSLWKEEVKNIQSFYNTFEGKIPESLKKALLELEKELNTKN